MATQAVTPERWLKGPWSDLIIGCGAWSLPLLAIVAFSNEYLLSLSFAFYFLALFCNNPHYMATLYRAYGTREDFQKYRFFTIYVGILTLLTVLLAHLSVDLVPWLLTLYLTWSPWHYSGQNFGLSLMMARRSGVTFNPRERQWFFFLYLFAYLVWFVELHSERTTDPSLIVLGIPREVVPPLMLGLLALLLFGFWKSHRSPLRRHGTWALFPSLILLSSQLLWFVVPSLMRWLLDWKVPPSYYAAGIIAFMHCSQYLWVTSFFAKRETETGLRGNGKWNFWKYYLLLVLGGIVLFIPGPWIASRIFQFDLFTSLIIFIALVNIHHFILDGALWKLRDGRIARLLLGSQRKPEHGQEEASFGLYPLISLLKGKRWAQVTLGIGALALVGVAALDQAQFALTMEQATARQISLASRLNQNDSRVGFMNAKQRFKSGDLEGALIALDNSLSLHPRNAPARHLRARIYFQTGEIEAAYQEYQAMRALFPTDFSTEFNLGLIEFDRGHFKEAELAFQNALDRDPAHIEVDQWLADTYRKQRAFSLAKDHYLAYIRKVLEDESYDKAPRIAQAMFFLGLSYEELGEAESARSWYRRLESEGMVSYLSPERQSEWRLQQQNLDRP